MSAPRPQPRISWWLVGVIIPFVPLLVVVVLLWLLFFLISRACLQVIIWSLWCTRGRDILFVYSDSPIWHDYVEANILPSIAERVVILNWSQRTRWRLSVARVAFYHFGGWHAFNPMAVVFRPFRPSRTFRFLQPFRDFKHGHPEALHRVEREFFGFIGVQRYEPSP